jgi:integrase/recombinase XerC
VEAIATWLEARGVHQPAEPLFISLSNSSYGHRLSGNALYNLVCETAIAAGISKHMSPHRIRHSGITAALDATGGDVRRVQKLSRHRRLDTLMIYDDQRKNAQGEITDLLAGLVGGRGSEGES